MTAYRYIVGLFNEEGDVLSVVRDLRERGLAIDDVYTPYAVHGLDKAMGLKPSRLTWVCFGCGFIGLLAMLYFEFWTSAIDWPINVAGKPFDSLPAFIPIAFEATILLAGLGVVLALLIRCGLFPGNPRKGPHPRVTDDQFAVVVRLEGAAHSAEDVRALMSQHHAVEFDETIGEDAA